MSGLHIIQPENVKVTTDLTFFFNIYTNRLCEPFTNSHYWSELLGTEAGDKQVAHEGVAKKIFQT